MARIVQSTILDAQVERVWSLLRESIWSRDDGVGATRYGPLPGGGRLCEQLLSVSDRERRLRYFLVEAPVALRSFVGELRVAPVTSDGATWCEWRAEFDPPPRESDALVRLVREEIVAAGLAAIRRALTADETPVAQPPARVGREAVSVVLTRYGGPDVMQLRAI